jgi:hypothetical protein
MTGTRPSLNDVKARIFSDHRKIRTLLDEVGTTAAGVLVAEHPGDERQLGGPIWRLFLLLDDHLAFEETELVPLLLGSGVWGKLRAQQLREEHHAQRTVLLAMTNECDGKNKSTSEVLDDAMWLVQSLRADMAHEEAELDSIRDEGVGADQATA